MAVVSITIPNESLKKFDELIYENLRRLQQIGSFSRCYQKPSEAELAKMETSNIAATIMITCNYARKDVDLKMTEVTHEFDDVAMENQISI